MGRRDGFGSKTLGGLYVHIPFCSVICPYCDFAVSVGGPEKRQTYVDALRREAALASDFAPAFDTLYFGGGTPSILSFKQLSEIVETLYETFSFADDTELFLEANPEDVSPENVAAWRRLGVTMLSLGVQSFNDDELAFLGRRHSADQGRRAALQALDAGFGAVSVDLIYALPGQSLEAWRRNLDAAVELEPQHLSCYELTVHRRTTFGKRQERGDLVELDQDTQADLFIETHRFLNDAGLAGYEVSNFAREPRFQSRHNMKYWRHVPYLGLGVGAHSFDGRRRSWNDRSILRYLRRVDGGQRPSGGIETLDDGDLAIEALMLDLRTYDGVDLERFRARHGVDLLDLHRERIERFVDDGFLRLVDGKLQSTVRGLAIADSLAVELSPV